MDKFIKVGIGVMILDDNQVLLGHISSLVPVIRIYIILKIYKKNVGKFR